MGTSAEVAFSKLLRRGTLLLFKYPVEVGDVIEAGIIGDLRDTLCGINKQT